MGRSTDRPSHQQEQRHFDRDSQNQQRHYEGMSQALVQWIKGDDRKQQKTPVGRRNPEEIKTAKARSEHKPVLMTLVAAKRAGLALIGINGEGVCQEWVDEEREQKRCCRLCALQHHPKEACQGMSGWSRMLLPHERKI